MTIVYDCNQIQAIVIDNGSANIKAGFAGDDEPKLIFPSIIGRTKIPTSITTTFSNNNNNNNGETFRVYVGDEVLCKRGLLSIKSVFPNNDNNIITNWDDMEKLWNHTFEELKIDSKEYAVMLTESPVSPIENKEKMIEIMFETFKTTGTYIGNQAVLSLYAHGKTTGIVLQSGNSVTHAVPIYDGKPITNAITSTNLAGRQLTNYLSELLINRGYSLTTISELEIVRDIKETLSYVSLDLNNDCTTQLPLEDKLYELPDGQIINIGNDSFNCTEPLFKPSLFRVESKGIHQTLYNSIMKCDSDKQDNLFGNILLAGGTTMIPGIVDRLNKELISLIPSTSPSTKINISAPLNRKHSAWIGGSLLSSINTFRSEWITKEQYDEHGLSIVYK